MTALNLADLSLMKRKDIYRGEKEILKALPNMAKI
jgi:ferritin-like metal-binding protein YciE